MANSVHLRVAVFSLGLALIAATTHAADVELEIVGDLPLGKLAFVTGGMFGNTGSICLVGEETEFFDGMNPEFMAGGKKIIFANRQTGGSALFIRDLADRSVERIDGDGRDWDSPSVSPSNSKLVFVSWPEGRQSSHIFVANLDGSAARPLTEGDHHNWSPRWSPDGKKILFESTRDGERQVYVMDADGQNQTNLSNDKKLSHAPSWSPDGTQIAYMSAGEKNLACIFVMKTDGTEKVNISHSTTRDSEPAWSPDSEWIAFTRTVKNAAGAGAMDLWIMKRDGTQQQQLTRNTTGMSSYQPTWSR